MEIFQLSFVENDEDFIILLSKRGFSPFMSLDILHDRSLDNVSLHGTFGIFDRDMERNLMKRKVCVLFPIKKPKKSS